MKQIIYRVVSACSILLLCSGPMNAQIARPKAIRWNLPGIPDPGLTNRQVSGQSMLDLKTPGAIYWFAARPYSPGQSFVDSTNPKKLAASILGRIVSMNMNGENSEFAESPAPCATGIMSPFTESDIEVNTALGTGWKFTLKQNKIKNLNLGANVELDIKKLIGEAKVTSLLIDSLRAALGAGYNRLNSTEVKITGTYQVYQLSNDALTKLSKPNAGYFADCQAYLKSRNDEGKNEGIITSIGFVTYDVEYSQSIADSLTAKLDAILQRNGLNVSAKLIVDSRVKTNIDASVNRGYQVLVWRKATPAQMKR